MVVVVKTAVEGEAAEEPPVGQWERGRLDGASGGRRPSEKKEGSLGLT